MTAPKTRQKIYLLNRVGRTSGDSRLLSVFDLPFGHVFGLSRRLGLFGWRVAVLHFVVVKNRVCRDLRYWWLRLLWIRPRQFRHKNFQVPRCWASGVERTTILFHCPFSAVDNCQIADTVCIDACPSERIIGAARQQSVHGTCAHEEQFLLARWMPQPWHCSLAPQLRKTRGSGKSPSKMALACLFLVPKSFSGRWYPVSHTLCRSSPS